MAGGVSDRASAFSLKDTSPGLSLRITVFCAGMVKEYASPEALLRRRSSIFAQLVDEYAKRSTSMADLASLVRNQSKGDLSRVEH